ncbi:MAG: undecaprenyl-diphosphate phosphatase [Bacteroidaceae bacterium]|nr:undecaprenyl-diphosphate phosphatase [Bacteroidaceae bacterium]
MTTLQTIIIAVVEGLTEFLPVSSTGHMIITQNILGVESTDFVKAFTIIIQFGAILSVVCLYWKRFFRLNKEPMADGASALQRFLHKFDFYWKLLIAFLPAAFFGLLFSEKIDELLENVWVVASMLVIGGIFMLFCDRLFNSKEETKMTNKKALSIGLFQCIAMIPGVSRSMATIVGGMSQRLTRKSAAEFSFFLAVPTMFAATAYKLLKLFLEPNGVQILYDNAGTLIIGNIVAFLVALLAIKFFIRFITKYGFKAFGWYRIVVGGAILVILLMGETLTII